MTSTAPAAAGDEHGGGGGGTPDEPWDAREDPAAARAAIVVAGGARGASLHAARRGRVAELLVKRDVADARRAGRFGDAARKVALLVTAKNALKEAAARGRCVSGPGACHAVS